MTSNANRLNTLLATVVLPSHRRGLDYKQRFEDIDKQIENESKTLKRNEFTCAYRPDFGDMEFADATEGIQGVHDHIQKHLESWRNVSVHIAVIGQSGSGKSSFINAVRGLTPEDDGAARTGETEETRAPHPYPHPNNKLVVIWDLPGVGTPTSPHEGYLKKICFDRYDFYIIITCTRFQNDDLWLAEQVIKANKKFCFIRAKVDQDIQSAKEDYPRTFNEELTLKKIKENCVKNLSDAKFHDPPIFIISNRKKDRHRWDFPKVIEMLITDIPTKLKQEAMAFSLSNLCIHTHMIIATKKELLCTRAHAVAWKAAIGSACPLPGIGVHLDKKVLEDEEKFYRNQFGIDTKMMEEHGSTADLQIGAALAARYAAITTAEFLADKLKEYADSDNFISGILQMGKMATDAVVSYKLALATLQGIQDEYAQIALESTLNLIALNALAL